ncbi:MAG: enoyl-CoA hydratase-related protein, partial [Candidatus Azotimanducaceae bacterium]
TGRHMSATRAFELGLVNEVVSAEKLDETVEEWVRDILLCSPMAVRATKQAAMRGLDTTLSQAYSNSYEYETARANSDDAIEGPLAFSQKRKPQWKGFN